MKNTLLLSLLLVLLVNPVFPNVCQTHYIELVAIVTKMGWVVTSTTGGKHNKHSKHPIGKAVDISVRNRTDFDFDILFEILSNQGYIIIDERTRPKNQKVWGGPHIHISIPYCK